MLKLSPTFPLTSTGPLQRGFSLIELLVTIVIFSIGLLAIAGLQAMGKQANYESLQRSAASQIAYGLMEDMRMNGAALATYANSPDLGGGVMGTQPAPNCGSAASACTPPQRAIHDLWFWESTIDGDQEMNNGQAAGGIVDPTLCIDGPVAGDAGTYTIAIAWRGSVQLSNPALSDCGAGSGKYGPGDLQRRVLLIDTFIDPAL